MLRFNGAVYVLLVMVSLTGCDLLQPLVTEDVEMDNDWVGSWSLESINGESFENFFAVDDEVVATVTDNHWSFEADGNWYAKMAVTISNDEQGSIFRSETVLKLAGAYSLAGERYTFTLTQGGLFFEASDEVDTGRGKPLMTDSYSTMMMERLLCSEKVNRVLNVKAIWRSVKKINRRIEPPWLLMG